MFNFFRNRKEMLKEYDLIIQLIINISSLEDFWEIKKRIKLFKINWKNEYLTKKLYNNYNYKLYEFTKKKKKF